MFTQIPSLDVAAFRLDAEGPTFTAIESGAGAR